MFGKKPTIHHQFVRPVERDLSPPTVTVVGIERRRYAPASVGEAGVQAPVGDGGFGDRVVL